MNSFAKILVLLALIGQVLATATYATCASDSNCSSGNKCAYFSGTVSFLGTVSGTACVPKEYCGKDYSFSVSSYKLSAKAECGFTRWLKMGGYVWMVLLGLLACCCALCYKCCGQKTRVYY